MNRLLMMSEKDNVGVCLADGQPGDKATVTAKDGKVLGAIELAEETPFAHKIALVDIAAGGKIFKYGEVIGVATQKIAMGQWVHVHNIKGLRGKGEG